MSTKHTHIFSSPITATAPEHPDEYACAAFNENPHTQALLSSIAAKLGERQQEALSNQPNGSVAAVTAQCFAALLAMYTSEGSEVAVYEVHYAAEHVIFLAATLENGVQVDSADYYYVHGERIGSTEIDYEPAPLLDQLAAQEGDVAAAFRLATHERSPKTPQDVLEFWAMYT